LNKYIIANNLIGYFAKKLTVVLRARVDPLPPLRTLQVGVLAGRTSPSRLL